MRNTFKQFDKNGNGTISKEELLEGYKEIYGKDMSVAEIEAEVENIINKIDIDGNGLVDYSEWAIGTMNKN